MRAGRSLRNSGGQPFAPVGGRLQGMGVRASTGFGCVALIVGTAPAFASTTAPPRAPIEEIIITAQRQDSARAQFIQTGTFGGADQLETPLTVSVVTDEVLRAQLDESLADALRNTAGVTGLLTGPSVLSNISIRGIPVDGRTNYRLNGALPIVNFIALPLEDKARIEVLKGVSALYYGFATPSGIVNVITRRPPARPELNASVSSNNYGQLQGSLDGGATLGIVGLRGTLAAGSVVSGIEETRGHRSLEAGGLSLLPSERLRLDVDAENIDRDVTEPTIMQGPQNRALLLTRLPRLPDPRTNLGSVGFMYRAHELNVLGRVRWSAAPGWTVTADAGESNASRDRRFSTLSLLDPVTGAGTLIVQAADGQLYRNSTAQADISGSFQTGPFHHDLVIGASALRSRQYSAPALNVADLTHSQGCLELGLNDHCSQNAFDPIQLRDVSFSGAAPYNPSRDSKNVDDGLYAFDRVSFGGRESQRFSVIVGMRQSFYRQSLALDRNHWQRTFAADPLTISAALTYRPIAIANLYASYIEGIESVPPAPNMTVNQGEVLPPGRSKQIEVGAKIKPLENVLATVAYFDVDRTLTYVNSLDRFVNDGIGHFRGVEAALEGTVTPDLSVIASAVVLGTRENVPGDPVINGKRVENSAHLQWSIFAEYSLRRWVDGLSVNAGAYFTGSRPLNPENSLLVPDYTTFDLGASQDISIAGLPITARVIAVNIFSKRYVASTGSNTLAMGMPAAVRFELETHFKLAPRLAASP
jgi:iron complex outermembrane recepter protein